MLVSTRSRYGLRALVGMVRGGWTVPLSLAELAVAEEVSQRYLEQIFIRLREAGIVRGRRGPGGGYVLSRDPSDISLLEIIRALEADFMVTDCSEDSPRCSGGIELPRPPCHRWEGCATRLLWMHLRNCCFRYLGERSLHDLVNGNLSEGENVEIL